MGITMMTKTVASGFLALLMVIVSMVASTGVQASAVVESSQAATTESCVEPTDQMRRNHMDLLKHKRYQTMHNGVRTETHSLVECIDCHAGKDATGGFVSVNAEGQFCASCHTRVSAKPDCFMCHRSTPDLRARQ